MEFSEWRFVIPTLSASFLWNCLRIRAFFVFTNAVFSQMRCWCCDVHKNRNIPCGEAGGSLPRKSVVLDRRRYHLGIFSSSVFFLWDFICILPKTREEGGVIFFFPGYLSFSRKDSLGNKMGIPSFQRVAIQFIKKDPFSPSFHFGKKQRGSWNNWIAHLVLPSKSPC